MAAFAEGQRAANGEKGATRPGERFAFQPRARYHRPACDVKYRHSMERPLQKPCYRLQGGTSFLHLGHVSLHGPNDSNRTSTGGSGRLAAVDIPTRLRMYSPESAFSKPMKDRDWQQFGNNIGNVSSTRPQCYWQKSGSGPPISRSAIHCRNFPCA